MNIQHINIKFYLEHPEAVNLAEFGAVFNSWIQQQRLEELLIDVADYFIDLGEIADKVRKEITHPRYDERDLHDHLPPQYLEQPLQIEEAPPDSFQTAMRVVIQAEIEEEAAEFEAATEFIRITDDH